MLVLHTLYTLQKKVKGPIYPPRHTRVTGNKSKRYHFLIPLVKT